MSNAEIEKLESDLADAKKRHEERALFPKWIAPHESQVVRQGDNIVAPAWPDCHVNRATGEVTVLVKDADEEAKAAADISAKPEPVVETKSEEKERPQA